MKIKLFIIFISIIIFFLTYFLQNKRYEKIISEFQKNKYINCHTKNSIVKIRKSEDWVFHENKFIKKNLVCNISDIL